MSKVTSKPQAILPKAIAQSYQIRPGDDVEFEAAADVTRILPTRTKGQDKLLDVKTRLRIFDSATERQQIREINRQTQEAETDDDSSACRGWTREELYERGAPLAG
ncbi:MAG: AbrB/MazE/SpoVT family DNA-binding domain-containing protein [Gammaproteobacteria bacterium]|nr:AbrB/MazE/SpoVT family DNA-binding domain-containing protein [Gammaproteobacteria bacterium]